MSRALWFVAGAGAGVYVVARTRRAAEWLTRDGLADRLAGLSLGVHLFGEEVRAGMAERETELRARLHRTGPAELTGASPAAPAGPAGPAEPAPLEPPAPSAPRREVDH